MALIREFSDYLTVRSKMNLSLPWEVPINEYRKITLPNPEFIGAPEPIHQIENRVIAGTTGYLPIRIYRPNAERNLPAMLYFHGGGWVIGNMDGFEPTVRSIANKANIMVIQVQYQKAPERAFPIPFDDCYTTLEWVASNAEKLGINPNQIGVGGDSAGGNLAAAVALKARDTKLINLAFQMLVYPCTGNDGSLPSAINYSEGYGLTSKVMRWYENQYAQNESDKTNPYAFPAFANDLTNIAPAIVVTAQYDTLADDGRIYANRLKEVGALKHFKEYAGAIHGFNALAGVAPEFVKDVQLDLAREINSCINRST